MARQFLSLVADTDQSAVANAVPIPIFSCVGKSLVGGSNEDPFEHRQVDFAQERLGNLGLQIERLPGGHLTTNEQPEALAALIAKLERGLVRKTRASRRRTGYGRTQRPDVAVEVPPGLRPQRKLSLGNLSAKHTLAGLSA